MWHPKTHMFLKCQICETCLKTQKPERSQPSPSCCRKGLGSNLNLDATWPAILGFEWVNYSIFVSVFFATKKCQNGSLFGLMKCFTYSNSARLIYPKQLSTEQLCHHPAANGSWEGVQTPCVSLRMMLNTPIHAPSNLGSYQSVGSWSKAFFWTFHAPIHIRHFGASPDFSQQHQQRMLTF